MPLQVCFLEQFNYLNSLYLLCSERAISCDFNSLSTVNWHLVEVLQADCFNVLPWQVEMQHVISDVPYFNHDHFPYIMISRLFFTCLQIWFHPRQCRRIHWEVGSRSPEEMVGSNIRYLGDTFLDQHGQTWSSWWHVANRSHDRFQNCKGIWHVSI